MDLKKTFAFSFSPGLRVRNSIMYFYRTFSLSGCYGWWCFPCLSCSIASDMDECCLCGPTMAMRAMYRTRYNIKGSLFGDFCSILWCRVCSTCQLKRDIDLRKEQGIF
uniref:Placenta associated 8, tandem duplicate 2 n=1 Tax=Oncorhynchus mykiss TaxID=8022 RepID=A0A8K9UND3_ONCMY